MGVSKEHASFSLAARRGMTGRPRNVTSSLGQRLGSTLLCVSFYENRLPASSADRGRPLLHHP
jgi:hypothetical protein